MGWSRRVQEVNGAESVRKVLRLLLSFTPDTPLLTVGALATELGFPRSSVYRYVALLRELGLLEEVADGAHPVTVRVLPLARAALTPASDDRTELAHTFIERVAQSTGETTLLMQRMGYNVVAVDLVESSSAVRLAFERGKPMVLHLGSGGRVLMRTMSTPERAAYWANWRASAQGRLRAIPSNRELDRIARQGWVESLGEVEEGIWGVSAAATPTASWPPTAWPAPSTAPAPAAGSSSRRSATPPKSCPPSSPRSTSSVERRPLTGRPNR